MNAKAIDKLSLRDRIALEAMIAIISKKPLLCIPVDFKEEFKRTARGAYSYADAMLAARAKATS